VAVSESYLRDTMTIREVMGGIALELAREHQPDLVLLDLHLPDIGGDEVLHRFREDESTAASPAIVLSADATGRQTAELLAAGAHSFLTKPIRVAELLETVDRALREDPVPKRS